MSTTLSDYLSSATDSSLSSIILDLAKAGATISELVAHSGLMGLHGEIGAQNSNGDQVKILDDKSNVVCKEILLANSSIGAIASEEEENVVGKANQVGKYVVAFDPLDGSANIDINGVVGTIFSVLPYVQGTESDFLQPANKQLAAGYILYGSSTVLVFSLGAGVIEFTFDPSSDQFIMTNPKIEIEPDSGYIAYNPYVLVNMPEHKARAYKGLSDETARSMRWLGAMVGDVHRTLLKGGFFAYPENAKLEGKLRMQYEAKPLGWLVEQAGGIALTANARVGEYQSKSLHERVSVELGDNETMKRYQRLLK